MANRNVHIAWGVAVPVAFELVRQLLHEPQIDWKNLGAAAAGGLIGGVAPDVLEPATNPNHRQFFHSGTALVGVGACASKTFAWDNNPQNVFLRSGSIGYLSHLLLDARTPKGLPLIGKLR